MDPQALLSSQPSRLSQRDYHIYASYKVNTEAFKVHLLSFGTQQDRAARHTSIKDLERLAKKASQKKKKHPEIVKFQAKTAIHARYEITQHYKESENSNSTVTRQHEHFTKRMTAMYIMLFPEEDASGTVRSQVAEMLNRFDSLEVEELPDKVSLSSTPSTNGHTSKQAQVAKTPRIVDDVLGTDLELFAFLEEMLNLRVANQEACRHATAKDVPTLLAALIAEVVSAAFRPIEQRLQDLCGDLDVPGICSRFLEAYHIVRPPGSADDTSSMSGLSFIEALQSTWNILSESEKNPATPSGTVPLPAVFEQPRDYFFGFRTETSAQDLDESCTSILLRFFSVHGIKHANLSEYQLRAPSLARDLDDFLNEKGSTKSDLHLSFDTLLLLEGYKSHLVASRELGTSDNPRIQAMRFAAEIVASVDALMQDPSMSGNHPGSASAHIQDMVKPVRAFRSEYKGFSLYSQCPAIAGGQMLQVLRDFTFYGYGLLTFQSAVGIVIHTYNILTLFNYSPKLPILEGLLDMAEEAFFPGGRPTRYFSNSAMRLCGGRISVQNRPGQSSASVDWVFTQARHQSGGMDQESYRFLNGLSTSLVEIQGLNYKISEEQWSSKNWQLDEWVDPFDPFLYPPEAPEAQVARQYAHIDSDASSHRVQRLMQVVLFQSFGYNFPWAKVDHSKIYLACMKFIDAASDRYHPGKLGQRCPCFFETVLKAADAFADNRQTKPFGNRDLMTRLQEAMTDAFGEGEVDDYMWKNI